MLTLTIIALLCKTKKGEFIIFRLARITPMAMRHQ
jgi:hypothetical protein